MAHLIDSFTDLVFLRFIAVGLAGVLINFLSTFVFKEIFGFYKYLANSSAYILAISINFILNRVWTFDATETIWHLQAIKFLPIALAALCINHIVVYFFHGYVKSNFYLSKIYAVGIVFGWNYIMHSSFTFQ